MAFQSKLIKLQKENELRYRHIFLPISVVMMSVQVFGLFLAIKKWKASIKGCEGREKKEKEKGLRSGYYCFNRMTKSLGCNNVRPTGGKDRCFNISFIHWVQSGRKRSGFSMGALSGTSCSGDDQGPSPFGSAARAKLQRSNSAARRK